MIHKRPYDGEDVYDIACKHLRHCGNVDHFAPVADSDIVPANSVYPVSFSSGDDSSGRSRGDETVSSDSVKTVNECEAGTSGRGSKTCWVESDSIGCNLDSLRGFDMSFFPECFASADQLVSLPHESSSMDEYPSPKLGSEHQADVPDLHQFDHASDGKDFSYEERLIETCVTLIPMPRLDSLSDIACQRYEHTEACDCPDHGSVTCIRQHVREAREALKMELGDDAFKALGFNDMGETVSKRWTEEEEDLFHEVVCTNPARLGKNFWVQLSEVFPTRSKKDLVSYYFNVFMLRKRMEQNRCVALHIDSDDDGCQILEEDHKSMLESLSSQHYAAISHQEDKTEVRLDHIENDVEAHKEDAASSIFRDCKPLDEAEGSITDEYSDQNDSSASSEITKDERQPTREV